MKKRVAVIVTGGTIGSFVGAEEFKLCKDNTQLSALIEDLAAEIGVTVDIRSPLSKLSENFLPVDWVLTLGAIDTAISEGYQAIVVTHGTDTLHFTANYVRQFLADTNARVCFTGAFDTPDKPGSDAPGNIRKALIEATLAEAPPGVFAAFAYFQLEPSPSSIDVAEIMPMQYDQRMFRRCFGAQLEGDFGEQCFSAAPFGEKVLYDIGVERPVVQAMKENSHKTIIANSYPGSPMSLWENHVENGIIVIEAFHGGTGFVDASWGDWATLKKKRPDLTMCLASIPGHYLTRPYETSLHIALSGVTVFFNLPPHIAYICAVTRSVAGISGPDIFEPLQRYALKLNDVKATTNE